MRNIAVIPARSKSKGLKDKNIREINGKSLMAYSIEAAIQSEMFGRVHVSTDSMHYACIARQSGADVPFLRPEKLADDYAGSWDVLRYVIEEYQKLGESFDTVTLLQPTSPLRDAADIRNAFAVFKDKDAESVISVCQVDYPLDICNVLDAGQSMDGFIDSAAGRRQDMPEYYRVNGAIYIQYTGLLMDGKSIYGPNSYAYVMDKSHSVDIDDGFDFMVAEAIMNMAQHIP